MPTITKTDVGLNLLRSSNSGTANDTITYVSFGTDNTAPTTANIKLGAEVYRKKITSYANGATGEILVNLYLAPGDIPGIAIAEVGFWGGNATNAPNSGVLLARGLYSHTKTDVESIQFVLDLQYS